MHLELPGWADIWPRILVGAPTALAIIAAAVACNYVGRRALLAFAHHAHFTDKEVAPVRRAFKWLVVIAAALFVLGTFGVNVGGVWGVLSTILAMVAIGFVAVWSVLSNTLCTLMIMVFRPFAIGDDIEFPGEAIKGRVTDLNFMFTTLDAGDGSVIEVPNNLFFQKSLRRRRTKTAVSPADHLRSRPADFEPRPLARSASRSRRMA